MDTSGGSGGNAGGDGRFILGQNTTDAFGGGLSGTTQVNLTDGAGSNLGSRSANHHLSSGADTPNIPGLTGGAEAFGLLSGLTALDSDFDSVWAGAPSGALAALYLMDTGPTGFSFNWDGYDMLLYVNLLDSPITDPTFSVGASGYTASLMQGGWMNDALFGGSGDTTISSLAAHAVYGTLIPEGSSYFTLSAFGNSVSYDSLAPGESMYATPEPSAVAIWALLGTLAIALHRRRRRRHDRRAGNVVEA